MSKLKQPKTKIKKLSSLLEGKKITELALIMEIPYTQLYQLNKEGANPSILSLDNLALGLSKLHNKKVKFSELFVEN